MSLKPYDKFSTISNKTMVAIFPNVCLWRRSYAQNWEVLTLKNCYSIERPTLLHRLAFVSFLLFRKNLGNLREFFGQIVYCPPWQKIARTPMHECIHVDSRLTDCRVRYVPMLSNISTSDVRIEKQCMRWQFSQVIIYVMRNQAGAW